jgi:hypothetical protein
MAILVMTDPLHNGIKTSRLFELLEDGENPGKF